MKSFAVVCDVLSPFHLPLRAPAWTFREQWNDQLIPRKVYMSCSMRMAWPSCCDSLGRRAHNAYLTLAMLLLLGFTMRLKASLSSMALCLSSRYSTLSRTSRTLSFKRDSDDAILLRSFTFSALTFGVSRFLSKLKYSIQSSLIFWVRLETKSGSGGLPGFLSRTGEKSFIFDSKDASCFSSLAFFLSNFLILCSLFVKELGSFSSSSCDDSAASFPNTLGEFLFLCFSCTFWSRLLEMRCYPWWASCFSSSWAPRYFLVSLGSLGWMDVDGSLLAVPAGCSSTMIGWLLLGISLLWIAFWSLSSPHVLERHVLSVFIGKNQGCQLSA